MDEKKKQITIMKEKGILFWQSLLLANWIRAQRADTIDPGVTQYKDVIKGASLDGKIEQGSTEALAAIAAAAVAGTEYDEKMVRKWDRYLNARVRIKVTNSKSVQFPNFNTLRHAAQLLLDFTYYLQDDPSLRAHSPLRICPSCGMLFCQTNARQKACSSKCRFEQWRKNDPEYWKHRRAKPRKKR
jgi:hypothetical protein